MSCNCKGNTYNIGMGCCQPVLAPIENYYTKWQVDDLIEGASGCCITPEEVDEKIESAVTTVEAEIPSLSGYATEQWVLNQHYISGVDLSDYVTYDDMVEYVGDVYTKTEVNNLFVTKNAFSTYIANLQQQINSLIEAISGCCGSTGKTEYRWVTVPNDYACSGTTKMTKEKQQSSADGGMTWGDTGQYRTGSTVLEYNSTDCGYVPPTPPIGDYKVSVTYQTSPYGQPSSGQVDCNSSTVLTQEEVKSIALPAFFKTLEFGSCIDTIGEDAFVNMSDVSSITIPSNIKTLESCAFNNCGVYNFTINEGLTTIEHTAFINNYNITSITLPSTVTNIGSQAFYNCRNLVTVTVNATTPPITPYAPGANSGMFNNCVSLATIYVPAASVNTYKAADGWVLYADKIQPIP